MQRRCLAADVLAQRVDLIGRDVELVATLVREQQVVALDAADRTAHHALVAADAVLEVHHVHARLEVLEQRGAVAPARAWTAVGAAAAGEVGLGDDRHPGGVHRHAVLQRCDHHAAAGRRQVDGAVGIGTDDGEVETVLEEQFLQPPRRAGAVGRHHDAVAVAEQLRQASGERCAVAGEWPPARGLHHRCRRRLRDRVDGPERTGVDEQAVGVDVQAREGTVGRPRPRRGERRREVVLLGEQVGAAVAGAARLDEHDLCGGRQHVGEQRLVRTQPWQPALHAVEQLTFGEALPLLAAPRLGGHEPGRAFADVVVGEQLSRREDAHDVEVGDRALVVDPEGRQAVHVVAPQVDAHRHVAGRREHIDDRPPPGELAAVLHQLLAAVAVPGESAHERVGIDHVAVAHRDRLDRRGTGTEALEHGPGPGHDHGRAGGAVAQTPQQLEAPAHRLHRGRHPLERQRLPRRQQRYLVGGEELGEVVGELAGHRARRAGDHERPPTRQPGERGQRDRAGDLADRQAGIGLGEGACECRLVAQERGKSCEAHLFPV